MPTWTVLSGLNHSTYQLHLGLASGPLILNITALFLFSEMQFLSILKAQYNSYLFHILLNPQLVLFLCIHVSFSLHPLVFPTSHFFLFSILKNKLTYQKTLENTKDTFLIIVHALLFIYIFKVFPPKNIDFIIFIKTMHA